MIRRFRFYLAMRQYNKYSELYSATRSAAYLDMAVYYHQRALDCTR